MIAIIDFIIDFLLWGKDKDGRIDKYLYSLDEESEDEKPM